MKLHSKNVTSNGHFASKYSGMSYTKKQSIDCDASSSLQCIASSQPERDHRMFEGYLLEDTEEAKPYHTY